MGIVTQILKILNIKRNRYMGGMSKLDHKEFGFSTQNHCGSIENECF